jgi:hypothetical protein
MGSNGGISSDAAIEQAPRYLHLLIDRPHLARISTLGAATFVATVLLKRFFFAGEGRWGFDACAWRASMVARVTLSNFSEFQRATIEDDRGPQSIVAITPTGCNS